MVPRKPFRFVMIGIWVMIAAVVSTFMTAPFGLGEASGVVFVIGMVGSWVAGIIGFVMWLGQWLKAKLAGR
jgi:hypothetical protein